MSQSSFGTSNSSFASVIFLAQMHVEKLDCLMLHANFSSEVLMTELLTEVIQGDIGELFLHLVPNWAGASNKLMSLDPRQLKPLEQLLSRVNLQRWLNTKI